jgi:GT2 family glycosyltransferase
MLSVVVCSIDPQKQRAIRAEYDRAVNEPYEFIPIVAPRSLAEGYNRGFALAAGDIIVFSHDDIEIHSAQLAGSLRAALGEFDLVGIAGTSRLANAGWPAAGQPYLHGSITQVDRSGQRWLCLYGPPSDKIEALDGVFLAARKDVCAAVPFDQITFDGFHLYDLDFSHRAFLQGFKLGICEIEITHHSVGRYDDKWLQYADRFLAKHRGSLRPNLLRSNGPQWTKIPLGPTDPPTRPQI